MNSGESRQFTHNSSLSTVHSLAFTLAETLIVMGIIGVVAALTIPNVNKNTGEAEKVARFKKLYTELSEAHDRATAVYGPIEKWPGNDSGTIKSQQYIDRITEFLKVTKTCSTNYSSAVECMTGRYDTKKILTNTSKAVHPDTFSAILANGASFGVNMVKKCGNNEVVFYEHSGGGDVHIMCGRINLDIDGPKKGKNTFGKDLFMLAVTKDGIKPCACYDASYTFIGRSSEILAEANKMHFITKEGYCAGQWIMDFGNMDYLNVDPDTRVCKNNSNKQLGYPTTTPSDGKTIVQSCK